ncbi:uncharacterized protein LOC111270998 isoform X1 [Varroa jacobsoni]|uniref:uncharacterized protein LOC111270998 isoform X1 n=1 Tax=Varroa jacobsoni TaxID=62625 RepID=UPI000BF6FABB|nr:uncharacterized protein LOC111270998 isoform X1 [Varroa jacobsoni]
MNLEDLSKLRNKTQSPGSYRLQRMNMNTTLLRVATFNYKPFQFFNETGNGAQVGGFYGNILNALGSSLKFEFDILDCGTWGERLPNGSWTGAFGAIHVKEADITLCPTNPSAEYLPFAVQSPGLHPTELIVLAGRLSRFENNAFAIITTFSLPVWLTLACGVVLFAFVTAFSYWVLMRPLKIVPFTKLAADYAFILVGNIWQQAIPPPSFNSIRILWMSWYLSVTLILMCTFAGQMKASMMFKPEKKRIDSIFNVYQKKKLKLYIPKDSIIERLLKNHAEPWGRSLYLRIMRQGTVGSAAKIFHTDILNEVVHSRTVIIASRTALARVADPYCSVMPAGEFYAARQVVYSFLGVIHLSRSTLNERTRGNILTRLTWLNEGGLLAKWDADVSGAWEGCLSRFYSEKHEALEVQDLEGAFYIWFILTAVAIVCLISEIIVLKALSVNKTKIGNIL